MANAQLFKTRDAGLPLVDKQNHSGNGAYSYSAKHHLAQLAVTGCFNSTFYVDASTQLSDVMAIAKDLDDRFIAQTALYARRRGAMKDMPALLVALLAARQSPLLSSVFFEVIDSGKMLRNFVQMIRSGVLGRRSLGSRPKKLVQQWLNQASEAQLLKASVGNAPSLADVIKMVHPKPQEAWREAMFAWLIGKPCDVGALPSYVKDLLAFRQAPQRAPVPQVPFLLLSNETLSAEQWAAQAQTMSWQALRMNLNTLARHGVFKLPGMAQKVALRLKDAHAIKQAGAYPYQLLAAWNNASADIPGEVRKALQDAMEVAVSNVPRLGGRVVVCPDVSGSMQSPATGYRAGGTSKVRCIDVAGLMAAAVLRANPAARVLPFECNVVNIRLNARDSVMTNASRLAAIGGGGTCCSAPLKQLIKEGAEVDTVIFVSDNESWIDASHRHQATSTMQAWARIKEKNPHARLICIDIQPYGSTQAKEQPGILNVGGFSDAVFDIVSKFSQGDINESAECWVKEIEEIALVSI